MKYKNVPNIITGKDLDYLKDIFNWNYILYKDMKNESNTVKNIKIKEHIDNILTDVYQNMSDVLSILKGYNENK